MSVVSTTHRPFVACGVEVRTAAEELTEQFHLVGRSETVFCRALSLEGFRNPASDRVAGASHPASREHLGLAVMSGEWIQHLHVRFSEIVCVSGDDDKIVNERRRCDQTVLYRHRFTGLAQFSQKLCPSKARERIP
jgi:hypothetical protein